MKVKKIGRKALSLLIVVMMLVSLVPLSTFAASALLGNGTSSDSFVISSADDLKYLHLSLVTASKTFQHTSLPTLI